LVLQRNGQGVLPVLLVGIRMSEQMSLPGIPMLPLPEVVAKLQQHVRPKSADFLSAIDVFISLVKVAWG